MRNLVNNSIAPVIVASLLTLGLSACASTPPGAANGPLTPLSRYVLETEPGIDRIALAVREDGLSGAQHAALRDMASRYGSAGAPYLVIQAPAGDDPTAAGHAYAVRDALRSAGVPGDRIQMAGYAGPDARAPVLVGYETINARIPNCALQRRPMGPNVSNQSTLSLGCAITANMAAQIADPRDIMGARPMTPADSGRAAVVFDNYRKGQISSTPQEVLVNGQISRAVE